MTPRNFEIERFITCDYASQDTNGKLIVVGIVPPEIFFPIHPVFTIPFHCVLTIAPKRKAFEFDVKVINPAKNTIFHMECFYKNDKMPKGNERCNFLFQMPQGPFQGFGRYIASINENGKPVSESYLDVRLGLPVATDQGQVGLKLSTVTLNPVLS